MSDYKLRCLSFRSCLGFSQLFLKTLARVSFELILLTLNILKLEDVIFPNVLHITTSGISRSSILGIYKKDSVWTHNNRPVWRHVYKNASIFFNSNNKNSYFSVKNKIVSDDGVVLGERYWVVHDFRSNKPSANKTLRSSEKDFYHLPVRGWTYYSGAEWILDENLRVIGNICRLTKVSFATVSHFIRLVYF